MALPEDDFRRILDGLELGIGLLDREGRFRYANRVLRGRFAESPQVDGCRVPEVLPGLGGDLDWSLAARNAVDRGRTLRLARHELHDGLRVDCTLERFESGEGEASDALLTLEDVTEDVGSEARLLRQARTQAIANLGDSVAHEIRNPLNSIHMNVQLLREGLNRGDVEGVDRTAATVQREIKRLDRVVRDFVQYSRPPALALQSGSVNHVVRAALDLLDGQIQEKSLRIETDLRSAKPVHMDRDRVQRALYNVLLNAVQVLPPGGRIACRSRDEDARCLVEISDDGPGLDLVQSAHIFDIFYTTKKGGTGLGLPIANRIVEEHGGHMAVASEPGHGATFALFLPFKGPPSAPEAGPQAVPRSSQP